MSQKDSLEGKRIYIQLRPDDEALRGLLDIQASLPPQKNGRLLPASELHMTVVHFGKIDDVYRLLAAYTELTYGDYLAKLSDFIDQLPEVADFKLRPTGFASFGPTGSTLVVTYEPTQELRNYHQQVYRQLERLLQNCGIKNVAKFLEGDYNFQYASSIRPHITLYKGYDGELPAGAALHPINISLMKFVYD